MTTRSAVIEKVSGFSRVASHAAATRAVEDLRSGLYAGLIARLFAGDNACRTVAFASARPGDAVGRTIRRLTTEIERTTGLRCSVAAATDLLSTRAVRGRFRAPAVAVGGAVGADRLTPPTDAECEVLLVDGGSLVPGGDLLAVAREVDAIVMVVESGRTRRKDLGHAISMISAAGGRVAGLVVHEQPRRLPAWLERLIG